MALNVVGNISILERGDAPAQAVIDRNARSLAQRVADETRLELEQVMTRVDNIYGTFEMGEAMFNAAQASNMEYVNDIVELEELIKDQFKRRKYQQQVTIFIVGYEIICGQKLRLLQQVNEFFMENSKSFEEEDWFPRTPDIDLDDVAEQIEDSLVMAAALATRLGELNREMVEYVASNTTAKASTKGKKKLERSLQQAKDDINNLSEKLLGLQSEIEVKEEKVQQLYKQLDMKNIECQRYRTAAEVAKKSSQDSSELQDKIRLRDQKIEEMRQRISSLEIELAQSNHVREVSESRLHSARRESQARMTTLQKQMDNHEIALDEARRLLQQLHEKQMDVMSTEQEQEIEALKGQHNAEIRQLQGDKTSLTDSTDVTSPESKQGSRQEKSKDSSSKSSGRTKNKGANRQTPKSEAKSVSRSNTKEFKEASDLSIQNEDVESDGKSAAKTSVASTRNSKRASTNLETVQEKQFTDAYSLTDEKSWSSVPTEDIPGRFLQYRQLSRKALKEVETNLDTTVNKTQRKVQTLKTQFQEHKVKWEEERKILIEQVQLAQKLQKEAEKEADAAMTQLEDFINEQETIEHQEDAKRQELLGKSEGTPETAAQDPPAEKTETQEQATDGAEPDLQRLMKQTDDAKVQEKSSRITVSAPPGLSITEVDSADREKISTDNFTSELSTVVEDELNNDTIVDCDSAYGESSPSKQEVTTHRDEVLRSSGSEYSRTTPPAETRAESGKYSASGTSAVPPVKRKSFSSCSQGSEINIDSDSESDAKSLSSSISQSTASHNVMKSNGSESGRSSVLTSNSTHSNDLENDISDSASDNDGNLSWKRSDISSDTDDVVDCQINNIMSVHEPTDASDTYSVDELSIKSGSTYLRTELVLKNENTLHVQSNIITPPSAERLRTQSTYLSSVTSQSDLQSDTELSALSARSRSTLRSQYKLKLEESKTAAEDRRSRSPSIALMPSNSLDTEQQHEEDKLQADLIKVTSLGLGGNDSLNSSASSVSRASLVDQQIVNTFLKTYSGIVNFKEALTKVMLDKDMMSASQLLTDIEIFEFDRNSKVQPQLEAMTKNVYYMLGEMSSVISSILYNDREPSISSLAIGSREPTSTVVPKSYESVSEYAPPKVSQPSLASQRSSHDSRGSLLEKVAIRELQEQHETLQKQLDDETKKHEDQLSHNTAIMMEMQDTINKLQQELSTLGNVARSPTSTALQTPTESAIMFTRLDSDRNAKTMKRAINEQRLSPGPYREALEQMDDYVSLPAKRLNHLVKKYVHHCRMKDIEDKVKKSNSLNENVFDILDKMEVLQNQRAHRWANKMDEMGSERLRLASLLMDTLDTIEQESGIFLIKPMFSMRRQVENHYKTKLTRPHQPIVSPMREGPAPTPASYSKYSMQSDKRGRAGVTMETPTKRFLDTRPLEGDSVGLIGARMQQEGVPVGGMWAASLSHPRSISEENVYNQLQLNTPRILELDINRMLIGQNNISTMSSPPLSDDRLVNAAQNSLRSYITVNRPVVQPGQVVQERTRPTVLKENTAPPSTPQYLSSAGSRRMKLGDVEIPRALSSTPPLPPITPTSAKESSEHRAPDPPLSPPGSSLHQSPLLYESPMRQNTRSSARTLATSFSEYD